MKKSKLDKVVEILVERGQCDEEERAVIRYGLKSVMELMVALLSILVISVILNSFWECCLFLASFWAIRTYAGGFHCENTVTCYFSSCSLITIALIFLKLIPKSDVVFVTLCFVAVSFPIIILFSPVEAPRKPLDPVEIEVFRGITIRNLMIECILVLVFQLAHLSTLSLIISMALFTSAMLLVIEKIRILVLKEFSM